VKWVTTPGLLAAPTMASPHTFEVDIFDNEMDDDYSPEADEDLDEEESEYEDEVDAEELESAAEENSAANHIINGLYLINQISL
jgi:hypothetical protein